MTPIHDNPYIMGKIAAVNVTNDIFALNARNITNYSAFLGLPTDIPDGFAAEMLKGTRDVLHELESDIHGGHTIQNPWPLMGGTASSVEDTDKLIHKQGAKPNDRLIITKPLGIHPVMAADRTRKADIGWLEGMNLSRIDKAITLATKIMITSNRAVVQTIHAGKFFNSIHAMTDITGFGFRAHLGEMLTGAKIGANIWELPTILGALELDDLFCYGLSEGKSAEIAGPMVIAVDPQVLADFKSALDDHKVWWMEVGEITSNHTDIRFKDTMKFTEISQFT